MFRFLGSQLRTLVWFVVGLIFVVSLAFGLPLVQSISEAASPTIHAYTPTNQSGSPYWSVGVTKDPNHSPDATDL